VMLRLVPRNCHRLDPKVGAAESGSPETQQEPPPNPGPFTGTSTRPRGVDGQVAGGEHDWANASPSTDDGQARHRRRSGCRHHHPSAAEHLTWKGGASTAACASGVQFPKRR
jgi:hypothetical protein